MKNSIDADVKRQSCKTPFCGMIPYLMSDVVVKILQLMAIDSVLNNFSVSANYGEACYKTVLAVMDPLLVSFKKSFGY
jgi:hypothetical protein